MPARNRERGKGAFPGFRGTTLEEHKKTPRETRGVFKGLPRRKCRV